MPNYAYPGVYAEESNLPLLSVPTGATAVPVFMGSFKDPEGDDIPLGKCFEVASWFDFTQQFATPSTGTLAVSKVVGPPVSWTLQVPVLTADINWQCVKLYFDNGGGRCYIMPLGAAPVAATFDQARAIIKRYADITLLCSTLGAAASTALYDALSPLQTEMGGHFLIADSQDGLVRPNTVAQRTAVYYPSLTTAYVNRPTDAGLMVSGAETGVTSLAELKKISTYEALYGQISQLLDAFGEANPVVLPASPAIAGVYCRTDASRGPWQAPAGALLNGVTGVDRSVTPAVLNKLMENRINAVKAFAGEGVRVWGARTMVPPATPLWLHIQVMRLFDSAARDIKSAMQAAVFMPNNATTWAVVRNAIENYLYKLWRDGGLKGAKADEAYYVQIGHGLTMTDEDVADGRLIVNVGIAALRPVEFIEVVFSQVLTAA